jgi:hypothetical protein
MGVAGRGEGRGWEAERGSGEETATEGATGRAAGRGREKAEDREVGTGVGMAAAVGQDRHCPAAWKPRR